MANSLTTMDMQNKANVYPVGAKYAVVAGADVDTNIAVTGIATTDKIIYCVRLNRDATAANINVSDVTSEVSITSDGNIQLDTTDTTGDTLMLHWWDVA